MYVYTYAVHSMFFFYLVPTQMFPYYGIDRLYICNVSYVENLIFQRTTWIFTLCPTIYLCVWYKHGNNVYEHLNAYVNSYYNHIICFYMNTHPSLHSTLLKNIYLPHKMHFISLICMTSMSFTN